MSKPFNFSELSNVYPKFITQNDLNLILNWNESSLGKITANQTDCDVLVKFIGK